MRTMFFALLGLAALGVAATAGPVAAENCVAPGRWIEPATGKALAEPALMARMARRPVVLLGETHANAEHHRWQLHTIAALHGRETNMVLAFEAFPRRVQPVLDRWIRGELGERSFLRESEWDQVWRYDPDLYMPLFHFARIHRIPMLAINVDRELVSRVGREGWASVPDDQRQGVTSPAPASDAYLRRLSMVYGEHGDDRGGEGESAAKPAPADDPAFRRFVEAQLTWDRAMAQAMAEVRRAGGDPLIVAVIGGGHVEYGHGVPHQLRSLKLRGGAVLLPWDADRPCTDLTAGDGTPVADAVFGVSPPKAEAVAGKPKLGVQIENTDGGIAVRRVIEGSVAEAAGLTKDDVIVEAAGMPVARSRDFVSIVRGQPPGTWLPIKVRRHGVTIELVARFPRLP